jgi:formimidoylglutamate deiminase
MTRLFARTAMLEDGWAQDVAVEIVDGRIARVERGRPAAGALGCLLPAPVNLHSHAFQRAMAGMTERRSAEHDSFWTWRQLMYRFLDRLTPEDVQAIAAFVQMEMAEAGYAAVAEFHYLHHQPGGIPYADPAEMSARIAAAAEESGLGLMLLPVLYHQGGCDGRALGPGQIRFGTAPDRFAALWQAARDTLRGLPADTGIGVAPHSLRAVSRDGLRLACDLAPDAPLHIHAAEQPAEVAEVLAHCGARPVDWLLANHAVHPRWCLIHATQMDPAETLALAASGAVAGLCPITEANLGDGIFDGLRYFGAGGRWGAGSDSNLRIALSEELRQVEYAQRLQNKGRALLATPERSSGRVLLESACRGGAQAAARGAGVIRAGEWADLLALDMTATDLEGRAGDMILDTWIFAGDDRMVSDLWSAGRHLVQGGRHRARDTVEPRYRRVMDRLRDAL